MRVSSSFAHELPLLSVVGPFDNHKMTDRNVVLADQLPLPFWNAGGGGAYIGIKDFG